MKTYHDFSTILFAFLPLEEAMVLWCLNDYLHHRNQIFLNCFLFHGVFGKQKNNVDDINYFRKSQHYAYMRNIRRVIVPF